MCRPMPAWLLNDAALAAAVGVWGRVERWSPGCRAAAHGAAERAGSRGVRQHGSRTAHAAAARTRQCKKVHHASYKVKLRLRKPGSSPGRECRGASSTKTAAGAPAHLLGERLHGYHLSPPSCVLRARYRGSIDKRPVSTLVCVGAMQKHQ
ncbi:MAG: hypothetical protein J3K34DRAFT_409928 [Monoraphidium minutum]|nr:MAG: hypothetical protein J3K34DRAFT_409928 [Monoraphidium minutum]